MIAKIYFDYLWLKEENLSFLNKSVEQADFQDWWKIAKATFKKVIWIDYHK